MTESCPLKMRNHKPTFRDDIFLTDFVPVGDPHTTEAAGFGNITLLQGIAHQTSDPSVLPTCDDARVC